MTGNARGLTPSGSRILALLAEALERPPVSEAEWRWALPPAAQDALRHGLGLPVRSARLAWLHALLDELDRQAPRWQPTAAALLVADEPADDYVLRKALAVVLAARPLNRPDSIIEAVRRRTLDARHDDPPPCEHLLLALAGTDSVATLELWAVAFPALLDRASAEPEPDDAQRSLFLCFVKCVQHGLLAYPEFAAAVVQGRVLTSAHDGGRRARPPFYHPVLDYLGLTRSDAFRLAYQRLACELTAPGRLITWHEISSLRRFWSAQQLLDALDALERNPSDPVVLYLARWTFGLDETAEPAAALARFRHATLMLLSLLRSDLDPLLAEVLGCREHADFMRWVRSTPRQAFRRAVSDAALGEWSRQWSPALLEAVHALTRVTPPTPQTCSQEVFEEALRERGDPEPEQNQQVRAFVARHVCPRFDEVIENTNLIQALAGGHDDEITARARAGWVSAVRALGLLRERERERGETLIGLRRSGAKPVAEAAEEALELMVARHELTDIEHLERRLDLSAAWSDAGLEGKPARVWWEIAGHRLRLSIVGGRAQVTAYGARGPLKTIPRRVRQHSDFEEVTAARREVGQQYARFRRRFEEAMVCRQPYTAREAEMLAANPMVANILSRLVVRCDNEDVWGGDVCGEQGIRPGRWRRLWIVHPLDLLVQGTLRQWQDALADRQVAQPFKQCFREIYPLDPAEARRTACPRFSGHPVVTRQAFALLRSRHYFPGSGEAHRNWPQAGVQARLVWAEGVENLAYHLADDAEPVLTGEVHFRALPPRGQRAQGDPLPLGLVDPIICSETLRDADLVASRAAAGDAGFTSRETMTLRAALVRHLVKRFGLWHVAVSPDRTHALIQGHRATYRVHLGSGSAFLDPEGRHLPTARLAASARPLPLEDTDSATNRILALVLALAQDDRIRDEVFLSQIAGRF